MQAHACERDVNVTSSAIYGYNSPLPEVSTKICIRIGRKVMTMRHAYIVTGTLTDAYTLTLDEAMPLMSQKVRVVVEPLVTTSPRPYREVMATIRARQQARAHQPPTRKEVDAAVRVERESWED
jgi:hypothetical protein